MKRHKTRYSKKFDVNNHIVNIELFTQCVTSNQQEKSYRKKLCKVVFLDAVKENGREYTQIYFSNMRAAAVFISNHIDLDSMMLNVFGNLYASIMTVLSCNYKMYTINSIDGRDPWLELCNNYST
jgi:hypothetical protein